MNTFGYNGKPEKKNKMRFPLSAYLTYLLIATLLVTGVSFSRFSSTGWADEGAHVALVVVDGGSYEEEANLTLGDGQTSATYSFYVTNNVWDEALEDYKTSEVALDYAIVVTIPGGENLPEGVAISLAYTYEVHDEDGEWLETVKEDCALGSSENGVYTFDGYSDFAAGEWAQHDYVLTFSIGEESSVEGDYQYDGITISVKAEQID